MNVESYCNDSLGLDALPITPGIIAISASTYYWPIKPNLFQDGANELVAVGKKVTRFQVGQRVLATVFQSLIAGTITPQDNIASLGGPNDGVLCEYGVFNEQGLVLIPDSLSYREAATLPCVALTAWNALYGSKPLKPGDTVLVQGTGGVSLFALQFALAGGAEVIATTNDARKEEMLRAVEVNRIKPVIGEKVFKFRELEEAYQYVDGQKHIEKVFIDII